VLDGDPVGTQPPQQPLPTFGPCLLWPSGRTSQQLLSSCCEFYCTSWCTTNQTNGVWHLIIIHCRDCRTDWRPVMASDFTENSRSVLWFYRQAAQQAGLCERIRLASVAIPPRHGCIYCEPVGISAKTWQAINVENTTWGIRAWHVGLVHESRSCCCCHRRSLIHHALRNRYERAKPHKKHLIRHFLSWQMRVSVDFKT